MAEEQATFSLYSKVVLGVVAVFLVTAVYAITRSSWIQPVVPEKFKEAREQGATIAQHIVDLSNGLSRDLEQVNRYDKETRYAEALELTDKLIAQSANIRQEAIKLASELEVMARALPEVKSDEARQLALDAISNRLALITRLINYSNNLSELLGALRSRFAGADQDQKVQVLIDSINAEVTAINTFNRSATESMERFDTLVKEK